MTPQVVHPPGEIVKENGTTPPAGDKRSVAELIAEIRVAARWAGAKNPSRFVLAQCIVALTDLSRQLHLAQAEIAYLKADAGNSGNLPAGIAKEFLDHCNAPG